MISMTTARAAAPNLGGRANTRGRAVVATSQSPTFTAAIRSDGAACLLGDFYFYAAGSCLASAKTQFLQIASGLTVQVHPVSGPSRVTANRQPEFVARAAAPCCTYGCTKSAQRMSDAGSIPAASTTTGALGFDGMSSSDGQLVMVPAASGSAESRRPVRWAKFQTPTMTSTQSAKRPDVPAGRGVTNAGTLAGFGPLATFTTPPRTTTRMQAGNYGNGWRFFYQSRRRAAAGPLPALAGNFCNMARKAAA